MIIMLERIRSDRIKAMRALRTLDFWAAEDDETYGKSFHPGVKEVLGMINALPIRIGIWPDNLPKFEEDFHVKILSNPPSDYRCECQIFHSRHPWAAVHFPGGILSIVGSVKELADTIYKLLGDGHPENRITIEFLGGGPITPLPGC